MEPNVAVHPANLDDDNNFIAPENSKSPCMYLLHVFAEKYPSEAAQDINGKVLGGQKNEDGECVFEVYFAQDSEDYLVTLVFGPQQEENSVIGKVIRQEKGDGKNVFQIDFSQDSNEYLLILGPTKKLQQEAIFYGEEEEILFQNLVLSGSEEIPRVPYFCRCPSENCRPTGHCGCVNREIPCNRRCRQCGESCINPWVQVE